MVSSLDNVRMSQLQQQVPFKLVVDPSDPNFSLHPLYAVLRNGER